MEQSRQAHRGIFKALLERVMREMEGDVRTLVDRQAEAGPGARASGGPLVFEVPGYERPRI